MRVNIKYTSSMIIENHRVMIYVTEGSVVYIGLEIMPYIESKQQIKQLVITDVDNIQYIVYPMVEVCRFVKKDILIELNTRSIELKERQEIKKKESSEFVLTLKNIAKLKK